MPAFMFPAIALCHARWRSSSRPKSERGEGGAMSSVPLETFKSDLGLDGYSVSRNPFLRSWNPPLLNDAAAGCTHCTAACGQGLEHSMFVFRCARNNGWVLHLASHTRLTQVLPGHPPADPQEHTKQQLLPRSQTRCAHIIHCPTNHTQCAACHGSKPKKYM